jgi:hypothetical protein
MVTKIDPIEIAVTRDLKEISQAHLDGLTATADTRVMMHALLEREALRIELKLGASHPRARQLRARLRTTRTQINALRVERELLGIQVPKVGDEDALIHGRVVDNDRRGIAGLMVCVTDQNASPIRAAGEPTTDGSGYFAFTLVPKVIDQLRRQHKAGVFLAVFTTKGSLIHRQPKLLVLDNGARLVEEITLSRGGLPRNGPVEPPPPEPDQVVLPHLIGQPEEQAAATLDSLGLEPGERETKQVQAGDQVGHVLAQTPEAGSVVPAGSRVTLVIGETKLIPVPNVLGLEVAEARQKITDIGLTLGDVTERKSGASVVVVEQDPEAEQEVPAGTKVSLVVGSTRIEE